MPYKNRQKQREAVRKAVRKHRIKKKILPFYAHLPVDELFEKAGLPKLHKGISPLDLWLLFASEGAKAEVILIRHEGLSGFMPIPILSEESFLRSLRRHNFPYKVERLRKKFVITCIEVEEDKPNE